MKTKIVALDAYGTTLASDDFDNEMPARKGLEKFAKICNENNIKILSTSDAPLITLKLDYEAAGIDWYNFFYDMYQLDMYPKYYGGIICSYDIKPAELFVIGDNYDKDLSDAKEMGCSILLVPEYLSDSDNFDFARIKIP